MARRSLEQLATGELDLDPAQLDATTDDDIRRYKAEDGYAAMPAGRALVVLPPATIRDGLGMTQEAFARALRIPVATLRNWEQGRKLPDPAARSLLNAVARNPKAVLEALDPGSAASGGRPSRRRAG